MPPSSSKQIQKPEDNQLDRKAVPKFASFRPKPQVPSENQESRNKPVHGNHESNDDPPVKSGQYKHQPNKNHSGKSQQSRARYDQKRHALRDPLRAVSEAQEDLSKVYVVDKVGDTKNLDFGRLDCYAVPKFFRYGAGRVLGARETKKIDRSMSNETGLVLSDSQHGAQKRRDKNALGGVHQSGLRELRIEQSLLSDPDLDGATDFVSLSAARPSKKKRHLSDGFAMNSSSSSEDNTHYRSINGKAKAADRPLDQDLKYVSDMSSLSGEECSRSHTVDDSIQETRIELLRLVDKEPTNCDAWLDLINHQDKILGLGDKIAAPRLTNAERRGNAEVKTSMYERALRQVKDSQGRERLLLGMMDAGAMIWESQKLSSQWRSILQNNPTHVGLWTKFLDFRQTTFSSFRLEEVRSVYLDCLNVLDRAQNVDVKPAADRDKLCEVFTYVFLRMTLFIEESGFPEHATAAWQAVLEFKYYRPPHLQVLDYDTSGTTQQRAALYQRALKDFEDFWESEVSRIGEDGAQGWASYYLKKGEPPQAKIETTEWLEDENDLFASWVASEHTRGLQSRTAARTIDDVEDSDPYRVILFSDVQPYLIPTLTVIKEQLLLEAFIVFFHLPPYQNRNYRNWSRLWLKDGFLQKGSLHSNTDALRSSCQKSAASHASLSSGAPQRLRQPDAPFDFRVPDYWLDSDNLFASRGSWFSAFDSWEGELWGDRGSVESAWVLNCLKSLVSIGIEEDALAEYCLALELRVSTDTVKKSAKSLLKLEPSNFRLYNAYALVEYRSGNGSKGESVITTSIKMSKSLDKITSCDSIILWHTWLWELMCIGKTKEAIERLLGFSNEGVRTDLIGHFKDDISMANATSVLRTETALVAARDYMLSMTAYNSAVLAMDCLILLSYLRNSSSLSDATVTFKSNLALLAARASSYFPTRCLQEHLHQLFARLLYHHATHTHLFKPVETRSLLTESIIQFPQNTIFLSLYAWNESRFRIDDRVRSIVKDIVLKSSHRETTEHQESVITHFFAIHTELHRNITSGSNTSTIRSTFERAVTSKSGAHCAVLWRSYFLFEHSRGELQKANAVFYRGIRACPWVKGLYLLAFEFLSGEMGEAELRGVYEVMREKGLRVHVGLEDIFERWDEERRGRG